jgi:hypothetical protein
MKLTKAMVASGLAALVVAIVGVILLMNQPAQSKDDRSSDSKGVSTTLGF